MPTPCPLEPTRLHVGQHSKHGYIDPRLFEDTPIYLHPLEEIPNAIQYLFDDWGQSIPISIETICDEPALAATIVAINAEPLQLEYEGRDDYTYTIDIKFDSVANWRLARANGVVPYYFVIEP